MSDRIQLPTPSPEERTPLVEQLLALIERLQGENQQRVETVQRLRDELAILEGEKR